ncbi:hypothetical protein B296_00024454 [Ensete ventricosum]|uniref:Single-stranded DNA binding protein Ssb-like OB fold domain-containing protein n=1 Tax=Ensete ventricosum TaxID=4639 RepID=A0A427A0B3_ENSVE|nr:hypothetical protein B296_00024454 [Ensete ventricosum]
MAESKPTMRKPEFTKVDQLRPGTGGHTLTVKVVSSKMVLQKGRTAGPQVRQMRLAECLVGDETGMIVFTARNDQGRDAKVVMKSGRMIALEHLLTATVASSKTYSQSMENNFGSSDTRKQRENSHTIGEHVLEN